MGRFDRQIETALRLVGKYGQSVQWAKSLPVVADPNFPTRVTDGPITFYSPHICFLPLDMAGKEFIRSLGGGEAVSGTYYGLMGSVPFVPSTRDVVTRDGVKLDIMSIDLLSPNGQKILYTIIFNG